MRRRAKKRIQRIIKTGKKKRLEDRRAVEATGMRHVPSEAFFKAKRQHEKAIERLDDEELLLVYCLRDFMQNHTYIAPSKNAREDFVKTKKRLSEIFTREGALTTLKNADYLDEDLETALYVLKGL